MTPPPDEPLSGYKLQRTLDRLADGNEKMLELFKTVTDRIDELAVQLKSLVDIVYVDTPERPSLLTRVRVNEEKLRQAEETAGKRMAMFYTVLGVVLTQMVMAVINTMSRKP